MFSLSSLFVHRLLSQAVISPFAFLLGNVSVLTHYPTLDLVTWPHCCLETVPCPLMKPLPHLRPVPLYHTLLYFVGIHCWLLPDGPPVFFKNFDVQVIVLFPDHFVPSSWAARHLTFWPHSSSSIFSSAFICS